MVNSQKVNIYVDGFNFYYGLKKGDWRKYYWIDIVKLFEQFMQPNQVLNRLYYFSATPLKTNSGNDEKKVNQSLLFKANSLDNRFNIILGKYVRKTIRSGNRSIPTFEEKQTDVNIACHMIKDVVQNECDLTILVSADSDLVPPIKTIKALNPSHPVHVYFPPNKYSNDLRDQANLFLKLSRYEHRFKKAKLPNVVTLKNGNVIRKPQKWT